MNNYIKNLGLICLLLLMGLQYTKAQFTMTAEIRPRAEFRNGFKKLTSEGTDAAFFVEQRSRLYFDYKHTKFKLHLS